MLSPSTAAAAVLLAEAGITDRTALYGAVATVVVSVIGAAVALTSRRTDPPAVRYVDPPSTQALPAELSDLAAAERRRVDELLAELRDLRAEVDLWQQRAYSAGWRG